MKSILKTQNAPAAIGPYSQAVVIDHLGLLYTAGQLGMKPTGEFVADDISSQTRQALQNIQAILKEAGADMSQVFKTTIFLKDMNDFAEMNAVYSEFFTDNPPARSAVEVSRLPKDALIEIEAVATLGV
jgi:2-iminobutanoate/2-iminopropanoate deaminase